MGSCSVESFWCQVRLQSWGVGELSRNLSWKGGFNHFLFYFIKKPKPIKLFCQVMDLLVYGSVLRSQGSI